MTRHNFRGRHILITGASTGLGRAMAFEAGKHGAHVGLIARRAELLEELVSELRKEGVEAAYAAADVVDNDGLTQAVQDLENTLGPVYGLIANAGIAGNTKRGRLHVENANRCIDVNVKGVIHSIGAVQGGMLERNEGFISTVSSLAAYRGLPTSGPYSASKAAVSTLMESLRVDLTSSKLTFSTIHPGFVHTPLTAKASHPLPFVISAERAAVIMLKGLAKGKPEINYPWQLSILMSVVRRLPNFLYDWILSKTIR
jgi:short-subunit dehydrogenase